MNSRLVGFYQANGFLFTPVQIWAMGIVDGREVSQRLQSLGFSTGVQQSLHPQTFGRLSEILSLPKMALAKF